MPNNRTNYTDPVLTNLTVAQLQSLDAFVAERIFLPLSVPKQGGEYYIYPSAAWNRPEVKPRGRSSETVGSDYTLSKDNYFCPIMGFHDDVDWNQAANDDPGINSYTDAVAFVAYQIALAKEQKFVEAYLKQGVWTTDATPATKFSATNSDPIVYIRSKIRAAKEATGVNLNVLTVTGDVWNVLIDHSAITDRLGANEAKIATRQQIAGLLELSELLVADTFINTAAEGLTETLEPLVEKCCLLTHRPARPGLKTPSAGYTFKWSGLPGAGSDGVATSRFDMRELKSTRIETEYALDYKQIAADLGVFLYDVIA